MQILFPDCWKDGRFINPMEIYKDATSQTVEANEQCSPSDEQRQSSTAGKDIRLSVNELRASSYEQRQEATAGEGMRSGEKEQGLPAFGA